MSPQSTDLTGLGMAPIQAAVLGNQPSAVTGAGTAQGTATTILTHLVTVTAAGGATGIILPSGALVGTPYWVFNSSATTAVVYPPVGTTMNTTLNGGVNVVTHVLSMFIQHGKGIWSSVTSA